MLSSDNSVCQYPLFKSSEVKICVSLRQFKDFSIPERLYASFMVLPFSFLKSIQNLIEPSSFLTSTTALAHGLADFQIAPISIISFKCFLTSLYWWGGILWYLSLNGVSFISLMLCFTKEVLSSSRSSRAKRSWYSVSRSLISCFYLISPCFCPRHI